MSGLIEWLKRNDKEQHDWAFEYLSKKGFAIYSSHPTSYESLAQLEYITKTNPRYILAVRSMKAAWRQKKLRENRKGKTEFSLVISKEKKSKLSKLSQQQGKTLGETLEELINDELTRKIEHEEKMKKEKEILKQKLNTAEGAHKIKINELE